MTFSACHYWYINIRTSPSCYFQVVKLSLNAVITDVNTRHWLNLQYSSWTPGVSVVQTSLLPQHFFPHVLIICCKIQCITFFHYRITFIVPPFTWHNWENMISHILVNHHSRPQAFSIMAVLETGWRVIWKFSIEVFTWDHTNNFVKTHTANISVWTISSVASYN